MRSGTLSNLLPVLSSLLIMLVSCGSDNGVSPTDSPAVAPYPGMMPSGKTLDEILGVSSHMSRGVEYNWRREFEIEKLVDAGMTMVRNDFHWYRIEPEDDVWALDGYDVMTNLCRTAGLEVTAIFLGAPDWATPGGTPNEINPEDYADYTGHVAAHFADRIDYYEFWNEQNTSRFWRPQPNPAKYGELLKATFKAVHANDPNATVIFGGLSTFEVHFFDPHGIWNFLYRVYVEHPDICEYFDAMSIHPYTFLQQPSPELDIDLGIYHYPNMVGLVDLVRDTLAEIGCPDKRVQFTEVGWPSLLIGDRRQASYLARSVMLALANQVEIYDWYTFWDGSGSASLPTEDYFGLFTYPEQPHETEPKASYRALKGAHDMIGDARYAGDLREALGWDGKVYALVFVNDAGTCTIGLWRGGSALSTEETVVLPTPAKTTGMWSLYDQEGNRIDSGEATDDEVEVTISGNATYLEFPAYP